jgi:hypothetical protein
VIVTIETEKIAMDSQNIIRDIAFSFRVDDLLMQLNSDRKNGKTKEELKSKFKELVETSKERIASDIFEKLSYQTVPFRIFDRKQIYLDLKTKLLNNLILACKVAERDGLAVINKYKSIESFVGAKARKEKQKNRKPKYTFGKRERNLRISGYQDVEATERESFSLSQVNTSPEKLSQLTPKRSDANESPVRRVSKAKDPWGGPQPKLDDSLPFEVRNEDLGLDQNPGKGQPKREPGDQRRGHSLQILRVKFQKMKERISKEEAMEQAKKSLSPEKLYENGMSKRSRLVSPASKRSASAK